MSPSELKELLEKLGAQKHGWHYRTPRLKLFVITTEALARDKAILLKEEIRLALREVGYTDYICKERGGGYFAEVSKQGFESESTYLLHPDELHALATLYLKVKG